MSWQGSACVAIVPVPQTSLPIEQRLHAEMAEAAWTLATLVDLGNGATVACLYTALSYHLGQIQQRLFWLLSFLYDPQAMLRAQDHLTHGTEKRAYALEIIDVLVSQPPQNWPLPSAGRGYTGTAPAACAGAFPQAHLELPQRLQDILTWSEGQLTPWIKVCTLYTVAERNAQRRAWRRSARPWPILRPRA